MWLRAHTSCICGVCGLRMCGAQLSFGRPRLEASIQCNFFGLDYVCGQLGRGGALATEPRPRVRPTHRQYIHCWPKEYFVRIRRHYMPDS